MAKMIFPFTIFLSASNTNQRIYHASGDKEKSNKLRVTPYFENRITASPKMPVCEKFTKKPKMLATINVAMAFPINLSALMVLVLKTKLSYTSCLFLIIHVR